MQFRKLLPFTYLTILGLFLISVQPAGATTLIQRSLEELVHASDQIVVGRVVEVLPYENLEGRIVSHVGIEVSDVFKGEYAQGEILPLLCLGGVQGNVGVKVLGEPVLRVGDKAVFFIRGNKLQMTLRPVGMHQGVFFIESREGQDWVSSQQSTALRRELERTGHASGPIPLGVFLERLERIIENGPSRRLP